jgi:hypothetical protein
MEVLIELPTPTLMLYIINTNVHTGYLLEFVLLVSWEFLCVFGFVPSNLCGSCCPSSTFKSYIYFSIYNNSMFIWLLGFVYQFKEWVVSSKNLV